MRKKVTEAAASASALAPSAAMAARAAAIAGDILRQIARWSAGGDARVIGYAVEN